MIVTHGGRVGCGCRSGLVALLLVSPVAGLSAWGAMPETKPKAAAAGPASVGKKSPSAPEPPPRPERKVRPPTLDPAALDVLVDRTVMAARAPLAQVTNDLEFIRRVSYDLAGKPPTPEQIGAYFEGPERNRRARLIDQLLEGRDFARNWAYYWRDVIQFRATNDDQGMIRYRELEDWLADQFARNTPWDEIARQLIAGTGKNDTDGAVNFALAHSAQPVELAGEVSRIFMGVQIQCAQCHDHPTDSWKRKQFHELAAFFAGTKAKRVTEQGVNPQVHEVVAEGKPGYAMPDLKDPQKKIAVQPRFFLAASDRPIPNGLTAVQRRELAASYIIGQDNPWFARAFVNRIWTVLLGDGFYTPVDDMGPDRQAKAPEVIEAVASQWQDGGYDIRWLFRTIMNTRAYQRQVRSTFSHAGKTPFASNCASRLRGDQIAEALATILNAPLGPTVPDASKKDEGGQVIGVKPNGARFNFNSLYGYDPSTPTDDLLGTIPQALFLMNNGQVNQGVKGKVLGDILAATKNDLAVLEALYLRVLARGPTVKEVETCGRYLKSVGNRREAFEDIFWSLINSTEFISRR
jgi:Protein of unknown function (DUF1549)/Protein of unknown function (DUF1553)